MAGGNAALERALADRYRIEREIGEGGMATVYLAEDLRHHRKVAIKVLRSELALALGADRFLREIEIAASLRHPHILPLYDSGQATDPSAPISPPILYYVMPFVEGESLRARMQRERELPIDDALRIAREVADALSYAHAHGVVHRDIKPENILIESGHAVIADFGIAKAVAAAGQATALTATGMSIGTPAYMSPEQAAGERDLDGRSDLYSLACVFYEMLAGQPPFTGTNVEALVRQHLAVTPPPVTQFRPAVPPAIADALARALAKNPADRFNPVGQFAQAINAPIPSQPTGPTVTTRSTAPTVPSAPTSRRWRLPAAIAVVLGLAAATWAMLRAPGGPDADATPSIAVLPFVNLGGDTATAPLILGMHSEIVTQLTKVPGLRVASRNSALEYRDSDKSPRQIASELGVASLLTGTVQQSGNQVRFSVALADPRRGEERWAETYDRQYTAEDLFRVQAEIARAVAAALSVQLSARQEQEIDRAPTTNLAALDQYYRAIPLWDDRGNIDTDTLTVDHLERAVALDPGFTAAWTLLAQARSWLLRIGFGYDTLPAWSAVERVQALAPGSLDAAVAAGYYRYYARGDFAGALEDMEAAGRLVPNSSEILLVRALLERRLGRFDESVALTLRAGEVDPRSHRVVADLGSTYTLLRRGPDAERAFDRALQLRPTARVSIMSRFRVVQDLMGDTARARELVRTSRGLLPPEYSGRLEGRMELYARDYAAAAAGFARTTPGDFNTIFESRSLMLALVARAAGDSAAMRAHADTLVRAARAELSERMRQGPDDPFGNQATVETQMAVGMALLGEHAAATRTVEAALKKYPLQRDAIEVPGLLKWVAMVHLIAGRKADAIATLEQALSIPSDVTVPYLRMNPIYDGLRGEPGFRKLVGS